jgi:hypothetical protein
MNTARTAASLAIASLLLAACASTPETASAPGTSGPGATESISYVDAVNHVARGRGIKVVWINPPYSDDHED